MGTDAGDVTVAEVAWAEAETDCLAVRRAVFVGEQGVPEQVEVDGRDRQCVHVLAVTRNGQAVGTGRLLPEGRLGRLAVLPGWRRQGIATRIIAALEQAAWRAGAKRIFLHAQEEAVDLYRRAGYRVEGAPFLEAGIAHLRMVKDRQARR